ncbi:helix-turn-helix domain-containing protein [Ectothiorhodospiraceae bacterium 2226]|nr:helix-turn-helix domain-containing protein [Ectothiorhodospiraceae bacterium 2226]
MSSYSAPPTVTRRLQRLGRLIAAARRARGFTQTQLAERAGTSRPTINRVEQGAGNVAWGTVMTLCWLLDLPSDPDALSPDRQAELAVAGRGRRVRPRGGLSDDF